MSKILHLEMYYDAIQESKQESCQFPGFFNTIFKYAI